MKNAIINETDPFFKAHIQWDFGYDQDAKNRAWVTYISYHNENMFPSGYNLDELRHKVYDFAFDNGLKIEMEQATDLRFEGTNVRLMEDGSVYKNNEFYSPNPKYRNT